MLFLTYSLPLDRNQSNFIHFSVLGEASNAKADSRGEKRQRKRTQYREASKKRLVDYSSGLTVHGLNWLCTGSIPEKIMWAFSILIVIGFASYMISRYVGRYLEYELRTEIRYLKNTTIILPTMVFTPHQTLLKSYYCYKNQSYVTADCHRSDPSFISLTDSSDEFKGLYLGHNTKAINVDKSMALVGTQDFSPISVETKFRDYVGLLIDFLSFDDYKSRSYKGPFIRDYVKLLTPGFYNLYIKQILHRRLPHPYSSNCTDEHLTPTLLSTRYSQAVCMQQCYLDKIFEACGFVQDYFEPHYPHQANRVNQTVEDGINCLIDFDHPFYGAKCDCPAACEETEYQVRVEKTKEYLPNSTRWDFILYNSESKITLIQEVPDYTMEDMLGAIGGILGLAIGASSLSVVELCVYSVMFVVRKLY